MSTTDRRPCTQTRRRGGGGGKVIRPQVVSWTTSHLGLYMNVLLTYSEIPSLKSLRSYGFLEGPEDGFDASGTRGTSKRKTSRPYPGSYQERVSWGPSSPRPSEVCPYTPSVRVLPLTRRPSVLDGPLAPGKIHPSRLPLRTEPRLEEVLKTFNSVSRPRRVTGPRTRPLDSLVATRDPLPRPLGPVSPSSFPHDPTRPRTENTRVSEARPRSIWGRTYLHPSSLGPEPSSSTNLTLEDVSGTLG